MGIWLRFCAISLAFSLILYLAVNRFSSPWMNLALGPGLQELLQNALLNQRQLARLDPINAEIYRTEFENTRQWLGHLEVLRSNRIQLTRRYSVLLLAVFLIAGFTLFTFQMRQNRRSEKRLSLVREQLTRLSAGQSLLEPLPLEQDLIGRIQMMICELSQVQSQTRQRIKILEHLDDWREASRRIAHEIRTPLTSIKLELNRMFKQLQTLTAANGFNFVESERSIFEELARLNEFTEQFTAFAKLREPQFEPLDLKKLSDEFCELYKEAWPNLELLPPHAESAPAIVAADRRMLRQVLVNLCSNSAKAMGQAKGQVRFLLEREERQISLIVCDNGPGIAKELLKRLFEPYNTSRVQGEGMGLGLAISKKILIDHHGDLEWLDRLTTGATFALRFPA